MRRAVIASLALLVCASPAGAAVPRFLKETTAAETLMPGVTYQRLVQFTTRGPVVYHVLTAPKPGGLYALGPVLSNGAIVGRQRVTEIETAEAGEATTAGINGDLFAADGRPSGILIRGGALDAAPAAKRSSIGIDSDGMLHVDRIAYNGYWKGSGQRRALALNAAPAANAVTLYTDAWGPTTPPESGSVLALTFSSFPETKPNTDLSATVSSVQPAAGSVAIPPGGAVLVARGAAINPMTREAPLGSTVAFRLPLTPSWSGVTQALGGGPVVVRAGKAIFRANELFSTDQLASRTPRSAVGQLADGRIVLVAVDGRQPGYSVGASNFELALALQQLGCVTASALDGGSSTTMAFEGKLLNRPSDPGGEREVSEALLVEYFGVYIPPPPVNVVSPNGDGVDETQSLTYKLVRSSSVTATVLGPDGVTRTVDSGRRDPGSYTFPWTGTGEPEGRYQFSVTAIDDQGRSSTATQAFAVNDTIGFLSSPPSVVLRKAGTPLSASYVLARAAAVTAEVETQSGIVLRTLMKAEQQQPGEQSVDWDGRLPGGGLAFGGAYRLVVTAENALGAATLVTPFTARRG